MRSGPPRGCRSKIDRRLADVVGGLRVCNPCRAAPEVFVLLLNARGDHLHIRRVSSFTGIGEVHGLDLTVGGLLEGAHHNGSLGACVHAALGGCTRHGPCRELRGLAARHSLLRAPKKAYRDLAPPLFDLTTKDAKASVNAVYDRDASRMRARHRDESTLHSCHQCHQ